MLHAAATPHPMPWFTRFGEPIDPRLDESSNNASVCISVPSQVSSRRIECAPDGEPKPARTLDPEDCGWYISHDAYGVVGACGVCDLTDVACLHRSVVPQVPSYRHPSYTSIFDTSQIPNDHAEPCLGRTCMDDWDRRSVWYRSRSYDCRDVRRSLKNSNLACDNLQQGESH